MSKGKGGPEGRVPLSPAVKRSLAALGILVLLTGGLEHYMLKQPNTIAPISHALWFLVENAPWLPIPVLTFTAAFASHISWYRRPDDFWAPIRLRTAAIISTTTLVSIAATQAWALLAVMAGMMAGVVAAHRWWFRIEHFDEHLAQFHEEDGE